jgi:MFS family permease
VAFLVSIVIAAFIGSAVAGKVSRRKLMLSWLILGILATVPIIFFRSDEFLIVYGILAGLSFGVGFPSCQAFLAESTTPEERGRVAGIAILATFVLVVFSFLLKSFLELESIGILLLTIGVKSIGFLSFKLDPVDRAEKEAKPWRAILGYRDFNLYLLAYVLFMVAAGLVSLLWQGLGSEYDWKEKTNHTRTHYAGSSICYGWIAHLAGHLFC